MIRALTLVAIIALGYCLRRVGFLTREAFPIISKILMNVTLPCAVVVNFQRIDMQTALLWILPLSLCCNGLIALIALLSARRASPEARAFRVVNDSGYNIGCFVLPYIQQFLPPIGVVAACVFDTGNSFFATGGTYSIARQVLAGGEATTPLAFCKRLFRSVPLVTYVVMTVLAALHVRLPQPFLQFADTVGAATPFLSMFLIGLGFDLHLRRDQLKTILLSILRRYGLGLAFCLGAWFVLPFAQDVRKALAILALAPVSALGPAYTERLGGDVALASTWNSISIVISLLLMTMLMLLLP